ncbi:MAG: hypothetical protein AAFV80_02505 [Bacteroidota bacterium]
MMTMWLAIGLCFFYLSTRLAHSLTTGKASNYINVKALITGSDVGSNRVHIQDDNVFTVFVNIGETGSGNQHFHTIEQKLLQKLELETHN